jgi:hypothetical protein
MNNAAAGLAMGLNQAISQYLGMNIQSQQDNFKTQQDMANKKELMAYEDSLKAPKPSVSVANLLKSNPDFSGILDGRDPNEAIPMDNIGDLNNAIPKKSRIGGGGEDDFVSEDQFATFLELNNAPVEKIAQFKKSNKGQPVPSRNVNTLLNSDTASRMNINYATKFTAKMFEGEGKSMAEITGMAKQLMASVNNGKGSIQLQADGDIKQAAMVGIQGYAKLLEQGYSESDAYIKLGEDLGKKFEPVTAHRILANAMIRVQGMNQQKVQLPKSKTR